MASDSKPIVVYLGPTASYSQQVRLSLMRQFQGGKLGKKIPLRGSDAGTRHRPSCKRFQKMYGI